MRNKIIFTLVGVGVLLALASAYVYARPAETTVTAFSARLQPVCAGNFCNGIIESYQAHGENIKHLPGCFRYRREILVAEGESVKQGTPLLAH